MAETNPKAHHYVQRAYLEGFQDPSLERIGKMFLWVYIPGKPNSPFCQNPEHAAVRNYYYCFQDSKKRKFDAELHLQKFEDLAMPILHRLRLRKFSLTAEDRLTFAGYVALSHTRVPTFERSTNRLSELASAKQMEVMIRNDKALETAVEHIRQETGEVVTVDEYRRRLTGGSVVVTQTNRGWTLKQMIDMLLSLQKVIFKMHWTFLIVPERG